MFLRDIGKRILTYFWLKSFGATVGISGFFVIYFYLMNHPVFPVRVMPILGIDLWLPILSWTTWVYFSLWFYILIPLCFMRTIQCMVQFTTGAFILSLFGFLSYFLFPTAIVGWDYDWSLYPSLAFLKEADAAGNACPSLHVAFSVFAALWLSKVLSALQSHSFWNIVNFLWCAMIVVSTMTTKQHVLIDVLCGIPLGAGVYLANRRLFRRVELTI